MQPIAHQAESRWPHRVAVALVCATFPLVWVGGLVTTYDAGMAVPDWPTTYGYNLFLYPWQSWVFGPWDLFVEHGHRLLAATVGLMTIALVAVLWRREPRVWVRWLGVAALVAVCLQGVLGGMRVMLDERLLAKIHGCFGPAFFGITVALAVVTSRRWLTTTAAVASPVRLQPAAVLTTLFAYLQIVLGAQLRHVSLSWDVATFRLAVLFHLLVAVVLVVQIAVLAVRVWRNRRGEPWLVRPALGLAGLVGVQVALGIGTWLLNYGAPAWANQWTWAQGLTLVQESQRQALVTTAHVATGSLVFVTALALSLRLARVEGPARLALSPASVRREVLV